MKSILLFLCVFFPAFVGNAQSYFSFPDSGWSQTLLFGIHNGLGWDQYPVEFTYAKDSVIGGITYRSVYDGNSLHFVRNENGKVYQKEYNGDRLLYDFSLNVGDTVGSFNNTVVTKQKILSTSGDSLWYIEIKIGQLYPDTIRWLEGIGDLQGGLLKFYFPYAGFSHICTRNRDNKTIYANPLASYDCNCDYIHGGDHDNDGYRNDYPITKYIELTPDDWPPAFTKSSKHRSCDTLIIINTTGLSVDLMDGEGDIFAWIWPDSVTGTWEELFYYHLDTFNSVLVTHQVADVYYEIDVRSCFINDCNDEDSTVHAGHAEIPYNGIDNDCDPATPDDDIDLDGFPLASDCDDTNPFINPYQEELIYNGLDDDCNPATLDDDLDQDGYGQFEDCNDFNVDINPAALEIPNNGIDEDCDGSDLITTTLEIAGKTITIYPNPVSETLFISTDLEGFEIQLFDIAGQRMIYQSGSDQINIGNLSVGIYFLQISYLGDNVVEKVTVVK